MLESWVFLVNELCVETVLEWKASAVYYQLDPCCQKTISGKKNIGIHNFNLKLDLKLLFPTSEKEAFTYDVKDFWALN